jgi:hypothetical protein
MTKADNRGFFYPLARGLSAVVLHVESKEAAQYRVHAADALIRAMSQDGDSHNFRSSLLATLTGVSHNLPVRAAAVTVGVGAALPGPPLLAQAPHFLVLGPMPCRASTQELVDLLKHPLCVGPARRVVLDQLAEHYRRPFADHWEFVRFAREQNLGLDFTAPARRPEAPAPQTWTGALRWRRP